MRCSKLFTAVILCSAYSVLSAEENPITMPAMPAPPSIEMPSVNTPTMGGSFYMPGKIYTGRKNLPTAPKAAAPEEQHTKSAQPILPAAKANTENANKTFAQLSSAFGGTDYLSAADIQSLGQNGLFSGVYGLLGGASGQSQTSSENTNILLQNILTEIENLKKQLNSKNTGTADASVQPPINTTSSNSETTASMRPVILRFVINGYDILTSCKTVYFSRKETDGTFLLTADRKYLTDGKINSETFYFLFKADGRGGSEAGYNVVPQIMQAQENTNSLVYKLTKQNNLKAEKTGNLVSMRVNFEGLTADLLLDIGGSD